MSLNSRGWLKTILKFKDQLKTFQFKDLITITKKYRQFFVQKNIQGSDYNLF